MNNVLQQQLTKDSELFNIFFDLTVSEQKDISNIIEIIISKVQQMNQDIFLYQCHSRKNFYSNIPIEIIDKFICNIFYDLDVKYVEKNKRYGNLFTYHLTNLNHNHEISLRSWFTDPYKSKYKNKFELKINYIQKGMRQL